MALIVEDGTGRADAESFASVAEADIYHAARGQGDAWDGADDKEVALRLATDYLEQAFRGRWLSFRVTSTQRLSWPRAWVTMPDAPYGYGSWAAFIPNNVVPPEVKQACMELALRAVSGALAPDLARTAVVEKVGPIEVQYSRSAPAFVQYRAVELLLMPFLTNAGASVKLVRA